MNDLMQLAIVTPDGRTVEVHELSEDQRWQVRALCEVMLEAIAEIEAETE